MVVVQWACSMAGSRSCGANHFARGDNRRFVTRCRLSRATAFGCLSQGVLVIVGAEAGNPQKGRRWIRMVRDVRDTWAIVLATFTGPIAAGSES
jgi:hypothetical protein